MFKLLFYVDSKSWNSNKDPNITGQEFFDLVTYELWEIIKSVKVHVDKPLPNGEEVLLLDANTPGSDASFKEKRIRNNGKCYTFYPQEILRQLDINIITIEWLLRHFTYCPNTLFSS